MWKFGKTIALQHRPLPVSKLKAWKTIKQFRIEISPPYQTMLLASISQPPSPVAAPCGCLKGLRPVMAVRWLTILYIMPASCGVRLTQEELAQGRHGMPDKAGHKL